MKRGFARDRKGTVAIYVAMLAPVLTMALSLGQEVTNWAVTQVRLQRAADVAAIAGALNYKATLDAQKAATAAALMAQLNGGQGTTTTTWTAATKTLSDNKITAQITAGVKNTSNTAVKVTVKETIPLGVSTMFSAVPGATITGTSMVELVTTTGAGSGGQPCLVALSTTGSIVGSGSTTVNMPNCTIRGNNTIDVHGGGSLTTAGIWARGAINIDTWIPATGQHPNSGQIADPYAADTTLQTALTSVAALTGVTNVSCQNQACTGLTNGSSCTGSSSVTCTMKPGNYGSFAVVSGGPYTFNFQPGLYKFKGNMSFSGNTTSNGTGVTILTSGTFTGSNTFNFTITAPSTAVVASTGGIAGIALAGKTTGTVAVSGSDTFKITGVVYFPSAMFDASGSSGLGISTTSCLEIIAASIKLTGSSYFNSSCSSVNAATFTSVAGTAVTTATLVQ